MSYKRLNKREEMRQFKGVFVLHRVFLHLMQWHRRAGDQREVWASCDAMLLVNTLCREIHEERREQVVRDVLEEAKVH